MADQLHLPMLLRSVLGVAKTYFIEQGNVVRNCVFRRTCLVCNIEYVYENVNTGLLRSKDH
jgi:hypothetical protein